MMGRARKVLSGPGVPVVGNVAAGEPIIAEENIEDYYEVPSVIGGETGDYILKVRGDSMKDAGILEGDFVVVRPADEAKNGEIVVALLGDEATVKRFYRERNAIRLQPENKAHKPIRTQDAELLGKVVGVFRAV
jgi:repressor LexA